MKLHASNLKTWIIAMGTLLFAACDEGTEQQNASIEPQTRTFYVSFDAVSVESPWPVAGKLNVPQAAKDPLPAVVIVHGSNGVDTRGDYHARSLNEHGIATLEIDLWAARGNFSGAGGRPQSVAETLPDVFGALAYLSALPFIDGDRIGVMGFSWGGVVSMLSATTAYAETYGVNGQRFAAHLPFYPVCWVYNTVPGYEFKDLTGAPVQILAGELDDYDAPDTCPQLLASLAEEDRRHVSVTVYPGATHGWNVQGDIKAVIEDPFSHLGQGGEVRFYANPEIAERSRKAAEDFFRAVFERGS